MSIRVEECDVSVDFYVDHDRHRLEAEGKLVRGDGGSGDSPPVTSTPSSTSTPNPSTSYASDARKRREPDSEREEAVADKRPRRILNSDGESCSARGYILDGLALQIKIKMRLSINFVHATLNTFLNHHRGRYFRRRDLFHLRRTFRRRHSLRDRSR